ncbi:dihydrodipicolinate synthase family protein [Sphingobacterium sp. DK4209]|uniref:Dihydrodipicolinate synthase family protein n=1 Tax=Sphingobacterium zhuxiongii TaxID=2662364 RepID=A0A5Q0QGJ1_9SPHI|nr:MULTISPECIES: dihydrodipicolinate synthase family protein [unclassified Sphingobacterium]MVZ64713.1 dihydrodipicolinate synthase family protein [Sphingobacterium sp. DK4209]QGA27048.1 dihydrodipicolinate synthase family protein [Sphingobacterium sp. dk4302]
MNNQTQFKGLWPALFTPVSENERPNFAQLEKLCDTLVTQEVDGLYVLGSTGQGILFNDEDRKQVLETVLTVVKGRIPVMVQVGTLATRDACKLAEHASEVGAAAVSSVGPIYFGGGPKMALHHYSEIAKAGQLPFFPYQLGNNSIPGNFEDFIAAVLEIPFIEGMKLTTGNMLEISRIHNIAGDKLKLFSGADELICQAALSGTVGAIGTFYNLWGAECKYVLNKFKAGDFELARRFMLEFQRIIEYVLPNIWTFLRVAMQQKYQIDIGDTVAPLAKGQGTWDAEEVRKILNQLESTLK